MKTASDDLLIGRRALEGIHGCDMLEDLSWIDPIKKWHLKIRLSVEGIIENKINPSTEWHILLDEEYPWGSIKFYPDKEMGISSTFQHQNHNGISTEFGWRSGDLCLSTNFGTFSLRGFDSEPKNCIERLEWHTRRCMDWIFAASRNELVLDGHFFELPHFPLSSRLKFFFSEDSKSFFQWKSIDERFGIAELLAHGQQKSVFIKSFNSLKNKPLMINDWNDTIDHPTLKISKAMWILLDFIPVLAPWEVPMNWKQLKVIALENGINLYDQMCSLYIRASKFLPSCILLGFPIPAKFGREDEQIHWQPITIERPKFRGGFRAGLPEAKQAAKIIFHDKSPINWMDSQNGNLLAVSSRGRLNDNITNKKIIVVGAGALGSVVSECLVRAGCEAMTLIDPDRIELGNMSRHLLTTESLDKNKAEELGKRLSLIFPELQVKWIKKSLQSELNFDRNFLTNYDLIVDATGSDEVLHYISTSNRNIDAGFISVSLGMNANKLFFFCQRGNDDFEINFKTILRPFLETEINSTKNIDFPREGLGCWHPLFPARADDVFLMGGVAVKLTEDFLNGRLEKNLYVIEQKSSENGFSGLNVATVPLT